MAETRETGSKARSATSAVALTSGDRLVVGARLARVVPALAGSSDGRALWEALLQAPLGLGIRWTVLPPGVVGAPGHLEITALAEVPAAGEPGPALEQLLQLLSLAFPGHAFEPIRHPEELHFALTPFWPVGWAAELRPWGEDDGGEIGFRNNPATTVAPSGPDLVSEPVLPDADLALRLLSISATATCLEWSLAAPPSGTPRAPRRQSSALAAGGRPDRLGCRVRWLGAGGAAPALAGAALATALGFRGGRFEALDAESAAAGSLVLGASAWPGPHGFLVPVAAPPAVLPGPEAIRLVAPSLTSTLRPRLPDVELPRDGSLLGTTLDGRPVRARVADRLRHTRVIGQTGCGKTVWLTNRIRADATEGHGFATFDPKSDLVPLVREAIPNNRQKDLVELDFARPPEELPSLNLLECHDVATLHVRCGQVLELIRSLWDKEMVGPIFINAAGKALQILGARFESPGTIADLPRVFLDEDFRRSFLDAPGVAERVPAAVRWWKQGYARYSDFTKGEAMDYIISKFTEFESDPHLQAFLGQPFSTLDLRRIMDSKGILLCNLGHHGTNPQAAALATAVLVNGVFNAALGRAAVPAAARPPFFVYCDEFQRIAGPTTGAMLSEIRGFGVGICLAHQFMDQLEDEVHAAILGNCGTRITFRVGARDAARLAQHSDLSAEELTRLPNFVALAEVLSDGVPSSPFVLRAPAPPEPLARRS